MSRESVHSGMPPRTFVACAAIIALAFLIIDNWSLFASGTSRGQYLGRDLHPFWYGATQVWQGRAAMLFDPHVFVPAYHAFTGIENGFTPFPYPPTALLFYSPLGLLSYFPALVLWLVVTLAAFLLVVFRFYPRPGDAMIALLLSPAVLTNVAGGQNGYLSAFLLCGGLLATKRHPYLAGIAFGLLTYKPHLGLVLPFVLLAGGYYRTVGAAIVTAAALVAGTIVCCGTEPWSLYLTQSAPLQQRLLEIGTGPFTVMAPSMFMAGRLWSLPLSIDYALQFAVALTAIIGAVWTYRQELPEHLKAAVAMIAALIVTPYSFTYDMCIVAAAQVLLIQNAAQPLMPRERIVHAIVWLLPIVMIPFGIAGVPIAPFSMLLLLYIALRQCERASRSVMR